VSVFFVNFLFSFCYLFGAVMSDLSKASSAGAPASARGASVQLVTNFRDTDPYLQARPSEQTKTKREKKREKYWKQQHKVFVYP
jgi:hypothetical protein